MPVSPSYSPSQFPISAVIRAACGKVCSSAPSGHCCIPGVNTRRRFGFGDLLLSSCSICKAHHYGQQLSVHFFSGSRVVLYWGNYNYWNTQGHALDELRNSSDMFQVWNYLGAMAKWWVHNKRMVHFTLQITFPPESGKACWYWNY